MVDAPFPAHPQTMAPPIVPETDRERALLRDPRLRAGLAWGAHRIGHPEGRVADHVARFVELDAADEGKDLTFVWWFRRERALADRLPPNGSAAEGVEADDVVYVKAFVTEPAQQAAVVRIFPVPKAA
jgi:hypothetical protein